MQEFTYIVEVPSILYLMTGFETKKFQNENPLVARENALRYLSEIVNEAVKKKIIRISRFKDETSTNLEKLENLDLPIYWKSPNILDFKKIMECKIEYYFNDYVRRETVFNSNKKRKSASDLLDSYGFLCLLLSNKELHSHSQFYSGKLCFEFRNGDNNRYKFNEENLLSDYINQSNNLSDDIKPYAEQLGLELRYKELEIIPHHDFSLKMKIRETKNLFHDKNLNQKEVLKTHQFFEIEKIYLSLLNTFCKTYLFIPYNNFLDIDYVFELLHKTYPHQSKFEHGFEIIIDDVKYLLYTHQTEKTEKLFYSKQGKLYFRNQEGAQEADEKTTISELLEINDNDPELTEIMKII